MRKNKLFIFGLVAAFVAILSLTLVSSTWAKYTSTVTGSDSARVAKWAFNYNTNSVDLTNKTNLTINLFDTILDTDGMTETDVASGKIIAPGTKGTGSFVLQNKSEVSAIATITFTVENSDGIPVQFKDKNGTTLTATDGMYTLGTTTKLGTDAQEELQLNWEWPFDNDDKIDTELGIKGTATLTVTVTVVFTQID